MPLATLTIVLFAAAAGGVPPLSEAERGVLESARDGAYDHQEPAFAALAEHVAEWPDDDVGDAPIRLAPDLIAMRRSPEQYRGDLCLLEGRIETIERLHAPWDMFEAWFVRGESGEPALVYVHRPGEPSAEPFRSGQRVRLAARFFKRFEATLKGPGQTGETRAYAAFVGARPRHLSPRAATAGWVLPFMGGAVGLAGVVVVMLMVLARRAARRDRDRGRRVVAQADAIDEPLDLPPDPAEALAVLRRRAATPGNADIPSARGSASAGVAGVPPASRGCLT